MRKLIHVPIIHTPPDFGSVADEVEKLASKSIGEEKWKQLNQLVFSYWNDISRYFDSLEFERGRLKIYQDSLMDDRELGMKIIREAASKGSKNHIILLKLIERGGEIVKTEDAALLKKEYDFITKIVLSKEPVERARAEREYALQKDSLLKARDEHIAKRIDETLKEGETGVLFIGALHSVIPKLPGDIEVIEIKIKEKDIIL